MASSLTSATVGGACYQRAIRFTIIVGLIMDSITALLPIANFAFCGRSRAAEWPIVTFPGAANAWERLTAGDMQTAKCSLSFAGLSDDGAFLCLRLREEIIDAFTVQLAGRRKHSNLFARTRRAIATRCLLSAKSCCVCWQVDRQRLTQQERGLWIGTSPLSYHAQTTRLFRASYHASIIARVMCLTSRDNKSEKLILHLKLFEAIRLLAARLFSIKHQPLTHIQTRERRTVADT